MEDSGQLFNQLKGICLAVTKDTYAVCIQQGYAILVSLYDLGLTQEQVYQQLIQYHNPLADEMSQDYIADMIDFVVGWCAPQVYIWKSDGKFKRAI